MDRITGRSRDEVEQRYYGHAVDSIFEDPETGRWYATNEKYLTAVVFCPFCGERLVQDGR
jgi:hypothetical protein